MRSSSISFSHIARHSLAHTVLFSLLCIAARAQSGLLEARVVNLAGQATLSRAPGVALALRKGNLFAPGDMLVTGVSGRVVIELSDGSQIIVGPNTRLTFKEFRRAGSLRELLEVTLGRVRLKIKKLGGQPNPYRVNSPAVSIAVRGTEFDVRVAASGETRVAVYEGLVEVTSRVDPRQRRLVEPGRSVIVRPNGDISLFAPGPGGELRGQVAVNSYHDPVANAFGAFLDPVFTSEAIYDRYARNLAETSLSAEPALFTAFGDAHFDSLRNPAYAGAFRQAEGRVYALASFNAPLERALSFGQTDFFAARPADRMFNAQATYFAPVGARMVIGGGLAAGRVGLESLTRLEERREEETERGTLTGAVTFTNTNLRLLAARRFGERLSLGVQFDHLRGRGLLLTDQRVQLVYQEPAMNVSGGLLIESRTRARRTGLTLGLTREFAGGGKLGLHYRTGVAALARPYRLVEDLIQFDDAPVNERRTARAHEAGLLWRAALTRRLFYGAQSSLTSERIETEVEQRVTFRALRERALRAAFGGGLGFVLRPQTVFSFDVAGGFRRATRQAAFARDGQVFQSLAVKDDGRFLSLHFGAQTNLPRRFMAGVSQLALSERGFTDNCGGAACTFHFTSVSLGRNLSPNWLAQYIFATDYGRRGPSHSLALRYTFSSEK